MPALPPDRLRPKEYAAVRPGLIGTVTNAIRRACDRYRRTRIHGTEGRVPVSNGPIAIEWGNDLESIEFKWTDWRGSEQEARAKGRCTRCWGGILDEAEMVGLGYKVNVTGQQDIRVSNGTENYGNYRELYT